MNKLIPYEQARAERAQERMTEEMAQLVNRHHAQAEARRTQQRMREDYCRQRQADRAYLAARKAQLTKERRRVRLRAGWVRIGLDALLLAASHVAYGAMRLGLLKVNLAFPLALAATVYGGWLLRGCWQELKARARRRRG